MYVKYVLVIQRYYVIYKGVVCLLLVSHFFAHRQIVGSQVYIWPSSGAFIYLYDCVLVSSVDIPSQISTMKGERKTVFVGRRSKNSAARDKSARRLVLYLV